MASLEELAALLSGANPQSLAAENPYLQFQGPFDQLSSLAMQGAQQPERFSTREVLLSALAGGVGSGILGGLGKDYNNTLNDRYQKAVLGFGLGQSPTEESTQLPSNLFGEAKQKSSLFQAIDALKQADAGREAVIEKQKVIETAKTDLIKKAMENGNISLEQGMSMLETGKVGSSTMPTSETDTTLEQVQRLPKDIKGEAIKELSTIKDKEKAATFVSSQFDQAMNISSLGAAIPATTSANEMQGIQNGLTTFIQQFLGREMSQVERTNFVQLLPDWNDTKDQIAKKKVRFTDLMNTFAKATPILQDTGISPGITTPTTATPPTGYEFTGKVDAQGRRGIKPISRAPLG